MKRLASILFCTLVFLSGCASTGSTVDESVTQQFVASQQAVEQVYQLEKAGVLSNVLVMESDPAQVVATGPRNVLACISSEGGRWLQEHNECEYLPQLQCEKLGGEYNECASACRHNPAAQICIMMCVQVCQFSEK